MKRTSTSIQLRLDRLRAITAHISPYASGLAPETHRFVAALNAEAVRLRTGVRYQALANRIEARGAIKVAASSPATLGGWFLKRALAVGYHEGAEAVLGRGNSYWRKQLRKRAKTRAGIASDAQIKALLGRRRKVQQIVKGGERYLGPLSIVPDNWPKAWVNGVFVPIKMPHELRAFSVRTVFGRN